MVFSKVQLQIGDLLEVKRWNGLYSHWLVYAGDGKVIHLACNTSKCDGPIGFFQRLLSKSVVQCDKLDDVTEGCDVIINNLLDDKLKAKVKEEIVKFAEECLGKEGYNILFGNCETFANMCRYGNPVSFQAINLMKVLAALNAGIAVGKLTKRFLEDKIGVAGATVIGAVAGIAAAGLTLCLTIAVSFLEEMLIDVVRKASEHVLLTVGLAGPLTHILLIGNIVYIVYQVVTSDAFKAIFSWLLERFSDFVSSLCDLVARTLSHLKSEPQ